MGDQQQIPQELFDVVNRAPPGADLSQIILQYLKIIAPRVPGAPNVDSHIYGMPNINPTAQQLRQRLPPSMDDSVLFSGGGLGQILLRLLAHGYPPSGGLGGGLGGPPALQPVQGNPPGLGDDQSNMP